VGATVRYFGSWAGSHVGPAPEYRIIAHHPPEENPRLRGADRPVEEVYPDGTAYDVLPADMEWKFGNRDFAVYYVRRTSFSVVSLPGDANSPAPQGD
jgi:hypothetical protein